MADNQRRIARQTQILQDAQKRLERMDRAREQMVRQVEREAQILDEMLKAQDEVQRNLDSMRTIPRLDTSIPITFRSQYDQFRQTRNKKRLSPMDFGGSLKPPTEQQPEEHPAEEMQQPEVAHEVDREITPEVAHETAHKVTPEVTPEITSEVAHEVTQETPQEVVANEVPEDYGEDEIVPGVGDNPEHWHTLAENPGRPIYVSGRYVSTGHGTYALSSTKTYEYEVSVNALPISVGDTVRVPVHPTGHGRGEAFTTGHLQLRVEDIYTKARFHPYHDRIEE